MYVIVNRNCYCCCCCWVFCSAVTSTVTSLHLRIVSIASFSVASRLAHIRNNRSTGQHRIWVPSGSHFHCVILRSGQVSSSSTGTFRRRPVRTSVCSLDCSCEAGNTSVGIIGEAMAGEIGLRLLGELQTTRLGEVGWRQSSFILFIYIRFIDLSRPSSSASY